MQNLKAIVWAGLIAVAAPGAAQADSLWEHEESTLRFETVAGDWRVIRFERPSEQLADRGVQSGTVAFYGVRRGIRLMGEAFVFPPEHCALPPRSYLAAGALSDYGQVITLVGKPPLVTDSCELRDGERTELTYRFVRPLKKPRLLD